jgi:hypothetical protein
LELSQNVTGQYLLFDDNFRRVLRFYTEAALADIRRIRETKQ